LLSPVSARPVNGQIDPKDIRGGVFDTTSSNTGVHEGGMTHIENALGTRQMWAACKHHTDELILKHVYDLVMHKSTGPDDPLFKAFKNWWKEQKGIHIFQNTKMSSQNL
jgi:hypothetical protein